MARELAAGWLARPGSVARLSPPWRRASALARVRHEERVVPAGAGSALETRVWLRGANPGELERELAWRHDVARRDLERLAARRGPALAIGVTGAGGFLGRALGEHLDAQGHRVVRFVRGRAAGANEIAWDPGSGALDPDALAGLDAVVHLSGAGIAEARWTAARKRVLVASRVGSTRALAGALAARAAGSRPGPGVLVSTSAVGWYGDRADERLDEASGPGRGFLATLARDWERAAEPAREAGVRVVHPRIGVVLWPRGGALAKLVPPFLIGAGGRLGSGRAWWSWVGLHDLLDAIVFAIESEHVAGPINVAAPEPIRQAAFARALGEVLGRPSWLPAPALALRALLGRERADELLLASQRVHPAALIGSGFRFREPELRPLLDRLFGRAREPSVDPAR